jgi:putative toxin-antitoxin system antitoxin component (TIGR02293 family)
MMTSSITAVLGGNEILKRQVESEAELQQITRDGVPVATVSLLAEELSVDRGHLAKLIGISDRTLSRRMASSSRLSAEESDRTVRLARVIALARETLGTPEKASHWLQTPNRVLAGEKPLDLLDTDTGVRAVETVLGRIEYGLYS